jgi:carbon-monoxide dehydrogenase medium subunit
MKPPVFAYHAPSTLAGALAALGDLGDEARVLAGGQSLIPMMNLRLARPSDLIDLRRITALRGITRVSDGLRIGAMTLQRDIEESPEVRRHCPLLAEAASLIGYPEIRNRGTIGGNIANADPASELPAALVALGASMRLARRRGERIVPAEEFFVAAYATAAAPDEILISIDVPDTPAATGAAFIEYSRRHGDFALVGVAALVTASADGVVTASRLVLSGVGSVPCRCVDAEARLIGARPHAHMSGAAAEAAARAADDIEPDDDIHASAAYRRQLARVLVARALAAAADRAVSGGPRGL